MLTIIRAESITSGIQDVRHIIIGGQTGSAHRPPSRKPDVCNNTLDIEFRKAR
jgi:hypothetical protein